MMVGHPTTKRVVVIGAGIGGLTTAAILARAGLDVTVLEAHVYPGGCAGTFYHKGYRFDAGATLAGGFYPGGPMDLVAQAAGIRQWPAHHVDAALTVHLPGGQPITRWSDERRWSERSQHFGPDSERFWLWQEERANALWDLALRIPPWPPQTPWEMAELANRGVRWLAAEPQQRLNLALLADSWRTVGSHLRDQRETLRIFVDAQLLIAAQTTSQQANALYGASALDLPRRGVVHLEGGIGAIAETLVATIRDHGGHVRYRQEVTEIDIKQHQPAVVVTKRGERMTADLIIANLPPWNIAALLQAAPTVSLPAVLRKLPPLPRDSWGAFMLYVGVDAQAIPKELVLHHQVIVAEPMGEGNTIFLSLSPAWDQKRAPQGKRAITISTHTALEPWWQLQRTNPEQYQQQKEQYRAQLLHNATTALPWLHEATVFDMPGTPLTFQRFTRRHQGWVGGFPQTHLWRTWRPQLCPNLWMVGDSIFPGQSTAAVALGGMRVAESVLTQLGAARPKVRLF